MKKLIQLLGFAVLAGIAFGCSGNDSGPRKTIEGDYSGPPKGAPPAEGDAGGSPVPANRPPSGG